MKQRIFLLFLAAVMALAACGQNAQPEDPAAAVPEAGAEVAAEGVSPSAEEPVPQDEPRQLDLSAVRDDIVGELALSNTMDMGPDLLANLYGIRAEDCAQCAAFVTMAGIFPHEVVMIEAVDGDAAERVAEAMNKRLGEVMNQAAGYDPENYALAQKCAVGREGLYVVLFLSPESERMQAVFDAAR